MNNQWMERIAELEKENKELRMQVEEIKETNLNNVLIAGQQIADLEKENKELKEENDLVKTRIASILWSGALDKNTSGEVQKWEKEYLKEHKNLQQFIAAVEKVVEKLPEDYRSETLKNMFAERETFGLKVNPSASPYSHPVEATINPDTCPACGAPMMSLTQWINNKIVTTWECTSRRTTGCKYDEM